MAAAGEDSSSVSLDYVSTGCSCSPHSCAWAADGLVAFASNRTVSIYSPSSEDHKRVVCTLRGHTDRVNCVAWFTPSAASVGLAGGGSSSGEAEHQDGACCSELVSGSVDRTVIVWRIKRTHRADDGESLCVEMVQSQVLSHHSDVVVSVATCSVNGTEWIASSSADSTVCMWKRSGGGGGGREQPYEFVQSLTCGRRSFVLDVSFGLLPVTGSPLLACAAEDMHIHLWALQAAAAPAAGGDEWRLVQHLAGHEDWVRTVEFAQRDRSSSSSGDGTPTTGDLLLASGAQDSYVRVWRIVSDDPITDAAATTAVSDGGNVVPEIRLRENSFSVGVHRFSATLDAVLSGHEHWIYGVTWQPAVISNDDRGTVEQPLCLLSASMDKTLMVWRFDHDASVWLDESRMGDIGGNTLGFYGAAFSPCGQWIIGHGYQGAFHLWRYAAEARTWQPRVVASGHFGPVLDLAWSPDGCLLSVSKDQTCRLHAEWNRPALTPPASSTTTGTLASSWHEVARPQIHGYDLQCLAMTAPFQYACGADEKVIRVFDASALFLRNLSSIGGREVSSSSQAAALPLGATVPALGLSNKAVYGDSDAKGKRADEESEQFGAADVNRLPAFSATELCSPPYEEDLLQNTLWPETQKLYGHGYELFALASDGRHYLASACKASKAEHAAVLLWDTQSSAASSSWKLCGTLTYHGLTVTQLCFSNSGEWLLAVSRDRTWSLWRRDETSSGGEPLDCMGVILCCKSTGAHPV